MVYLLPLVFFLLLYLGVSLVMGDFYVMPVTVAFLAGSAIAVCQAKGSVADRMRRFSLAAADPTVLLMIWIYILAGAFAQSASAVGAVEATVNLTLTLLPSEYVLAGLFLASCLVSLAIGTSVGTIAALIPVAVGVATECHVALPLMVGVVAGGAYFGDNLSFISDTTIAATETQGAAMRDKFRANLRLVLPVAIVLLCVYAFFGHDYVSTPPLKDTAAWRALPYLVVIVAAIAGLHVAAVLPLGIVLTGVISLIDHGGLSLWLAALGKGIAGMGELVVMALLAAGMLGMVREAGGLTALTARLTANHGGCRQTAFTVCGLTALVNLCTANNTVAILTTGSVAKTLAIPYARVLSPRRMASLLDTTSCSIQGLLPYSAQLLTASALIETATGQPFSPISALPYLTYPLAIGFVTLAHILFLKNK